VRKSTNGIPFGPALSRNPDTNSLYCFWTDDPTTDHVYYKKYAGGAWDINPTDWIDESVDTLGGSSWLLNSFYIKYGSWIGVSYTTGTSPYKVRFAAIIPA
jgi:hypothetical protein